jgi:CoA:oxalate CoA-transferase
MGKPLKNIVVLDLTRVLAGPYCTMVLNNLGARVIKVERPEIGDDSRHFGPFYKGESAYFASINAGKESITLNLKTEEGKKILKELVKKVDVLVENYKPGVMEKLGLGYEELIQINPKLIYAAVSGFGHSGPYSQKPAYDMIVQAAGGIMSITGPEEEDAPPVRVGTSVGDITAALFGAIGVVSALYRRELTGKGTKVDVAMLDSQLAILENAIVRYQISGEIPRPLGNAHPSITPFQGFQTKDSWIIIAAGNDKLWANLCKAIQREDLLEVEEFKTNDLRTENKKKLLEILIPIIKEKTTEEWFQIFEENSVPSSPINTVDKVLEHPQIKARNMVWETSFSDGKTIDIAGNPIKMASFAEDEKAGNPPQLGEHTQMILQNFLDFPADYVKELEEKGVI